MQFAVRFEHESSTAFKHAGMAARVPKVVESRVPNETDGRAARVEFGRDPTRPRPARGFGSSAWATSTTPSKKTETMVVRRMFKSTVGGGVRGCLPLYN